MAFSTSDPRFRRRLNEFGQSVENATEQAQSGLYIFGEHYVKPCFESITSCLTTCVDASCPSLNIRQRDRLRRQRGRGRSQGRAELNFDFYDDWDDLDEADGLLGWGGNDDFDGLVAGGNAGYGAISQQPALHRGMSYAKGRRKSAAQGGDTDGTLLPGAGFISKLFGGGKALKYKPSAADLQEHPGQRRRRRDMTEGEALLEDGEASDVDGRRRHRRTRSGTAASTDTGDSYSSRGDIFPSDEEDAIPLDDEFAMVLERRNTQSGPETESSSGRTRSERGKRPSAGSRASTRRTVSTKSMRSDTAKATRSRSDSGPAVLLNETQPEGQEIVEPPTLHELKQEERRVEQEEEVEILRKREEARRVAAERGLPHDTGEDLPSKEGTPEARTPTVTVSHPAEEPSQLPTPLSTDDEDDSTRQLQSTHEAHDAAGSKKPL